MTGHWNRSSNSLTHSLTRLYRDIRVWNQRCSSEPILLAHYTLAWAHAQSECAVVWARLYVTCIPLRVPSDFFPAQEFVLMVQRSFKTGSGWQAKARSDHFLEFGFSRACLNGRHWSGTSCDVFMAAGKHFVMDLVSRPKRAGLGSEEHTFRSLYYCLKKYAPILRHV